VPTDTERAATPRSFALRLVVWSLLLFGLFRLSWVAAHLLLPATRLQAAAGVALFGASSLPIEVTLACSGADALALCLAAILAYPAAWRMRAAGVAGGTAGILLLNIIRIGTLGRAAASPRWFETLHVYVWPAVLTIAITAFVVSWMRYADRRLSGGADAAAERPAHTNTSPGDWHVTGRFALTAAVFLFLFTIASPLYLESARVLWLAGLVARAAAGLLRVLGVNAGAGGGMLATPRGAFVVTQECISTPLIPVYAAAVLVYASGWRRKALWMAAAPPLFMALGVARLLVVAVPSTIENSPSFFIHAFSQLLVGAGMVCGVAVWRYGTRASTSARIVAALAIAIAFVQLLGAPYTHAILWLRAPAVEDPQGALTFLPAFQFGLFLALWFAAFVPSGWRRFFCGASLLAALQVAVAAGVQLLASSAGIAPLVRDVRAWALVGPALIIAMVVNVAPARR